MTRLKASNAETGIWNVEGWQRNGVGDEVARDNSITPYAGSWSWCFGGDGINKFSWLTNAITVGNWLITRCYVRISAFPAADLTFYPAPRAGITEGPNITLTTTGTLKISTSASLIIETPRVSAPLVPGNWHKLEFAGHSYSENANAGNFECVIARLDGVEFGRYLQKHTSSYNRAIQTNSTTSQSIRVNVDEVVINDNLGSADNYWADDVKPLSRSASGYVKPSVRSVGSFASKTGATTTHVLTAPPTVVEGDLLVAVIAGLFANAGGTPPTGWTLAARTGSAIINTETIAIYTKRATSSEPSTYNFTGRTGKSLSIMYSLANVGTSPVLDGRACSESSSTSNMPTPGLDLIEGDALLAEFTGVHHASALVSTNFASVTDGVVNNKDAGISIGIAGGFYGRNDGGFVKGEMAIMSIQNINGNGALQVAFRGSIPPAPSSGRKFEMVV